MEFSEISRCRQSCRRFDSHRAVEEQLLRAMLDVACLAPSACNGQPYHFTVCRGDIARQVARATTGMGMNKFTADAPVMIVISEKPYVKTAALGARMKGNDYRSIDIGITCAYLTAEATALGLSTCILGWFDDAAIRELCGLTGTVRLVIAVGYAREDDPLRPKKRRPAEEMITWL